MRRIAVTASVVLIPLVLSAACERSKSATPLSPSLAGPIAGVEITPPLTLEPEQNVRIPSDRQPVTLLVENAASNGVRPLSYVFEISTDDGFANKVFSQSGVRPGDGRTALQLPNALSAERVYFWRAKAYDGANEGGYSAVGSFQVYTPVMLGVPGLVSPANGSTVTSLQPALVLQNASVSGPAGNVSYIFEVATDGAMANRVAVNSVAAGGGQTSLTIPNPLVASRRYYWRGRANASTGPQGDWSPVWSFVTPAAATAPPGGGGSGGGGGGGSAPAPNDQIDLNQVIFAKGANIAGWAVTSTVTRAYHSGADMCIEHTKAGVWPRLPFFGDPNVPIEGNQWFFAMLNGRWVGGANEWLRPGQQCKIVDGHVGQGGYGGTALANWTPAPGELIGVAVSTPARNGQQGTAERSNVVLIRW